MIDMIASPFKRQILHMIEALLDVMKWPSWILHLSDCVTTSTIAAIIVLGPRPIFHCTRSTVLLLQNSEWTRGFGFLLLRMWPFSPPGAIRRVLIDHRNHSADLWKVWGVTGDFQRRAVQGAGPAGEFLAFATTLQVHKLYLPTMTSEETEII